ncbi:MAG: hypothetical protein LVS60_03180 [Nodosilinea sp. LVE1205-7]
MNLLCLSNGHGEDAIAVRILKELRQLPQAPTLRALPMVGEGGVYDRAGIARLGPTRFHALRGVYLHGWAAGLGRPAARFNRPHPRSMAHYP